MPRDKNMIKAMKGFDYNANTRDRDMFQKTTRVKLVV